jgi:hypothetical protein
MCFLLVYLAILKLPSDCFAPNYSSYSSFALSLKSMLNVVDTHLCVYVNFWSILFLVNTIEQTMRTHDDAAKNLVYK